MNWQPETTVGRLISLVNDPVGLTVRQLRGWYAVTYFPSVDLQQLCDSSHDEGEMGLPRELIDEIMHYNDFQTLKSCSLTSRAFYSAARPFIHRRMVLGSRSLVHGSRSVGLSLRNNFDQADVLHARYLSEAEERDLLRHGYVREVDLDLYMGNPEKVLQLRQLRALETVHTLRSNRWTCTGSYLSSIAASLSLFRPCGRSASRARVARIPTSSWSLSAGSRIWMTWS